MSTPPVHPGRLVQTHDGLFPWAVSVGEVEQAGTTPSESAAPLLLPTAAGGLWFNAAADAQAANAAAVERAALALLLAMPWRHVQVQVFDFGIRKRFAALAQLQPMGLYQLWSDAQAAQSALTELERLARHRHHQLLDDSTPTLADYNQGAPQPEPFVLLVLHVDDFPVDMASAQRLAVLLPDASAAGIFVLAFGQEDRGDAASGQRNGSEAARTLFCDTLGKLYPQLLVQAPTSPDMSAALTLLGGPHTDGLAQVLARHDACLTLRAEPLLPMVARLREQAAAEEAQEPEQDFLNVVVGTTMDGRNTVVWRMGARSGCYNALMLGMPGSGKSTLLNNLIVGIAEQYTAQQIRLYLMDYKDGVEFQAFEQHPNVERIFLDNEDTAAATRLLQEFQATIHERNERFKSLRAQVRGLDDYNRLCPESPLPRIVLVVDEAQRLLAGADAHSHRFANLLVDVTRRGRSAGVHIVLSTQSLQGVNDVRRLMVAISLRLSFMLNSATDAENVLDPRNASAPLQLRKYEFVLNTQSGRAGANVLARGLPTPDVPQRLAAVRAARRPDQCITPLVMVSSGESLTAVQPQVKPVQSPRAEQTVEPPPAKGLSGAQMAATDAHAPCSSTVSTTMRDADAVLALLEKKRGIKPQLPPLKENP